jgi:hypothetical protein
MLLCLYRSGMTGSSKNLITELAEVIRLNDSLQSSEQPPAMRRLESDLYSMPEGGMKRTLDVHEGAELNFGWIMSDSMRRSGVMDKFH